MTSSDEFIWSNEALREFVDHPHPTVRRWAIERLGRELDDARVAELAAPRLADDDHQTAFEAFRLLEPVAGPQHVGALRRYLEREDTSEPVRARLRGLLAGLGDEEMGRELVEDLANDRVVWSTWSERAPDDFAHAVDQARGDADLPANLPLLRAVVRAARGPLAGPLLDAIEALSDVEQRRALLQLAVDRAGIGLAALPRPGEIAWDPDTLDDPTIAMTTAPISEQALKRDVEQLAEARDREDLPALVEACFASLATFADYGAREVGF